jgi:P-type Cu2+ transporter
VPHNLSRHSDSIHPSAEHATAGRHTGHGPHAEHSVAIFRDKFWWTLAFTMPVVFWSADVQRWLGYTAPSFTGSKWIPPIFGAIVFAYGGIVFLQGSIGELANRKPGMMTLISLGILVAFGASLAATFGLFEVEVWWELATLNTIMLLGHWLEMRAVAQSRGALKALAALLPDTAERVNGSEIRTVPIGQLRVGDLVLVRPGMRVPADGEVLEGIADVDESMITGESKPVTKGPGDKVIAGTVAGAGSLRASVTAVGDSTALSGIMRLVSAAETSGSRAQALADRAAALLFYVALTAGAATFIYWSLAGDKGHAFTRAATVLIIACPHALGLAIPLVIAISTSIGAQNGLLVKDRLALERARNLDVIVFDKTGTLTRGAPALSGVVVAPGVSEEDLLERAAAVEMDSEHTLAKVIVAEAKRRGLTPLAASGFEALPGRGAQALVHGITIAVGGPGLLTARNAVPSPEVAQAAAAWSEEGKTVLSVIANNQVLGALAVEDQIRPESKEAVDELHRLGLRVAMITGDSTVVAEAVARRIGIDDVTAEMLPAEKASAIKRLQAGNKTVAMVGDGVNDAPALATANVGVAIGAGTDVALESAGIVLVRNDPRDVVRVIELSRAAYRKMVENLVWATAYNVVAIPVAAGLFLRWGVQLPMSVGAIAMNLSTIIVAANAQLLRGLKLARTGSVALPRG